MAFDQGVGLGNKCAHEGLRDTLIKRPSGLQGEEGPPPLSPFSTQRTRCQAPNAVRWVPGTGVNAARLKDLNCLTQNGTT